MTFRTLAVAALAVASLATGALAQDAGSFDTSASERDAATVAVPREFSAPRTVSRQAPRAPQATRPSEQNTVPETFSSPSQ